MRHTPKRRPAGAGSTRQLTSGRWQARYRDTDGKMRSAPSTFDTKHDAETWLNDYAAGLSRPTSYSTTTLRDYFPSWLAERKIEDRTREHYERTCWPPIDAALGHVPLAKITPDMVKRFHASLPKSTPTQTSHVYGLLRTIMGTAYADDLIASQPCRVRGAASVKRQHQTVLATADEIADIATRIPARYAAMVYLAAYMGLRFGELTELRRSDVDLQRGTLRVARGVVRARGEYVVKGPKSDAGKRTLTIPAPLLPVVRDHLLTHVDAERDALMFPAANDRTRNLAPSTWNRVWYRARAGAGRDDLRLHDLRHGALTLVAQTPGTTAADIMAYGGHSTNAAAMRYQHAARDAQTRIADALASSVVVKPRKTA